MPSSFILINTALAVSGSSFGHRRLESTDNAKSICFAFSSLREESNGANVEIYLVIYLVWPHQYELVQPMG